MVNWKTIDELRDIFIQEYTESSLQNKLEKACSEEFELKRDYNGRQILELLQNVDDACDGVMGQDSENIIVKFSFKNNILEVGNTGTTFSAETIERLCLGRASEKSFNKIGNKGTGFRSLLNDADWIEVHSGEFAIRFSEKFAQKVLNPYCDKKSEKYCKLIDEQRCNWKKDYNFCFPVMNCPEVIKKDSKGFDTLIRVKVKEGNEEKETSIKKQLEQPFYKSLLFLPNITKIVIETDSSDIEYSKILDEDDVLIEEKIDSGPPNKSEEYYIYKKSVIIGEKEADLIIAVPKDEEYDFSNEKLYCFFPIRNFKTPIHALIHAPFSTNNSRDDVPDDNEQINRRLFIEILSFITEISEKIASYKPSLSIKMVTPLAGSKLWEYNSFNLRDKYFEVLSSANILPTVNNEMISIRDNPKIIDYPFPGELFLGKEFENLLLHLDEENNRFVRDLAAFIDYSNIKYSDEELAGKINNITVKAEIKTRVLLFLWWSEHYKSSCIIPRLLKDTNDSWILKNTKIYLPTDGGISVLPKELSWVEMCILEQQYVSEIIKQVKVTKNDKWNYFSSQYSSGGDKRILAAFSKDNLALEFIEQSSSEQIISSINQQVDTAEKAKLFISWVFNKYGEKLEAGSELSKVSFKLPDRDCIIRPINSLFLGKDYDNAIAEKLFQNTEIKPIASLDYLYVGNEKEKFISFLKKCGIMEYPLIVEEYLGEDYKFISYVANQYFTYNIRINYIYSKTVENFKYLIENLSTEEIKKWFSSDEKIKNLIMSQESWSYVKERSNGIRNYFKSNAYVKFILNTTPWVVLEGKKYPPCKIIKYEKIKDKIDGFYGVSEQELTKILGKEIVQFFDLDFKDSIIQLPDEDIKAVLDKLPEIDFGGEISRALYINIIKYKKGQKPGYLTRDIKVLAKDGIFYPNFEVKYADRKITKTEEENGHFISIHPKQSTETIRDWLGVERYKTNIKFISCEPLPSLNDFDTEIRDIKNAIMCTIDLNKNNIAALKRVEIIPCTQIEVSDIEQGETSKFLEDFFFVEKEKDKYYLKVPNDFSISLLRKSDACALAMVDIFKQVLTIELFSERIELLISKDREGKKTRIADWYGIDRWNNAYECLYEINLVSEQIINFFSENGLEAASVNKIKAINFTAELAIHEFEFIAQSLRKIGKDIKDLNSCAENLNIDFKPYFTAKLKMIIDSRYPDYQLILYNKLKSCDSNMKLQFLDRLEKYKNFDFSSVIFNNSILSDLTELLYNYFPELREKCTLNENLDKKYNDNVELIIGKANITPNDFDYFIQNNKKYKSILYFEVPENIINEIKVFLTKKEPVEQDNTDVSASVDESTTINIKLVKAEEQCFNCNNGVAEKSKRDYEHRSRNIEKNGEKAEQIAFRELQKTYKDIIWHSKYSNRPADRNNLPPNGVVCDMWVNNPCCGNRYFEIKSATSEFEMSINEYESMKKNKDNYEVVLVNNNTREISRHKYSELEALKQINGYKFIFKQEKIL